MPLEPGSPLLHYRLVEPIGQGGMGVVWKALDTTLGREIALKVLPDDVAADPARLARFQREARALASLDHPNIVSIHSVEECDGVRFITMDLVRGRPLADCIPAAGLPVDEAVRIAVTLADALGVAHDKGIVHRDLKPQNVMVGDDGRVRVLDFGLVKLTEADPSDSAGAASDTRTATAATAIGHVVGTVPYMSPEQLKGEPVDGRTDVFALGVTLYEMLAGRHPFLAKSNAELVASILTATPPALGGFREDVPDALDAIVRRCIAKDPAGRYASARELRRDLEAVSDGGIPVAAATTTATPAPAPKQPASRSRGDYDDTLRSVIEQGGESGMAALDMLRESGQRKAKQDAGWTIAGGIITVAVGFVLVPFLYTIHPGQPTWAVGLIPLVVGIVIVVWGRMQLKALKRSR